VAEKPATGADVMSTVSSPHVSSDQIGISYHYITPDIIRIDSPLPFRGLKQINLWLLRDGDGWTMVDCGFGSDQVRADIQRVWDDVLEGRPITRLIATHFHPDHMGNSRWICETFGIKLLMTTPEWMSAQLAFRDLFTDDVQSTSRFYAKHGLSAELIERYQREFIIYTRCVRLPDQYESIKHLQNMRIGGHNWTVVCYGGHSPAMAGLYCKELKIYISGDQILPSITPNISVVHWEPLADPLSIYLESLKALRDIIEDDVLVLPSHRLPFRGLHKRIDELHHHHQDRLDHLRNFIRQHQEVTGAEAMLSLFGDRLDGQQLFFAMGEALAHLNYLYTHGEINYCAGDGSRYMYHH
jgi:glyoxylase-like metal-dependent hydrolase (beta-lactamase superfamily II)